MSFIDNFDLSNYDTVEDLHDVRSSIECEISGLYGYIHGINEKIVAFENAEVGSEDDEVAP